MTATRRTKVICTIGPASAERVGELVDAGMDVARLNLSHGTPASWTAAATAVRASAAAARRPAALLVDLAGPKIRLGDLAGRSVALEAGRPFTLRPGRGGTGSPPGDETGASVGEGGLGADLHPGDRILLADGAVELRVVEAAAEIRTEVVRGGTIRSRAGVAIPADRITSAGLTERDIADLVHVRALGADYVAQSFVRRPEDVVALREHLGPDGPPIVAKIETRPAVERFDDILDVVDAVMVARGDLGVELPYEDVPLIQKDLVRRALDRGVPSIVATQVLESMTAAPRPTRAEASDAANAVFDGTDALLLSGETAIGAYPVLAVEALVRIVERAETAGSARLASGAPPPVGSDAGSLAYAAAALAAADPGIAAIACFTRTGRSARLLASLRPAVPVIAFSPDEAVVRRLALVHGVLPRPWPDATDRHERLALLGTLVDEAGLLPAGSAAVLVASTAVAGSGPDLLKVHRPLGGEAGTARTSVRNRRAPVD